MNINLGTGLFSDVSKALATSTFKVQHIPFEKLNPNNDEHGFSLDGIEELAESIADIGLEQNLVVEDAGNGTYNILTGRRRYYAIKHLLENGNTKYKTVPCVVKKLSDIDLPVSDDIKRMYAIVTTNAEQRKPTAADTAEMIRKLNAVYDALETAGAKPKGRRREFIAAELGISPATVGKYEYISNNADNATKEAVNKGEISLSEATRMVKKENCATGSTIEQSVNNAVEDAPSKKVRNRNVWATPYATESQTFKRDALFIFPEFRKDEYELDADTYEKVMKKVLLIRATYKGIQRMLEGGRDFGLDKSRN